MLLFNAGWLLGKIYFFLILHKKLEKIIFFSRSQPAFGCHQHLKQLSKLLVSKGWALRQSNATEVQHLLAYRSILCQLFEQDWPTLLWGWFNNIVIFNKYLVSYCTIAYILFLLLGTKVQNTNFAKVQNCSSITITIPAFRMIFFIIIRTISQQD